MITFKLPIPFLVVGIILLLAGYHFVALDLKIGGAVILSWGFITHVRNIRIVRRHFEKQRSIL